MRDGTNKLLYLSAAVLILSAPGFADQFTLTGVTGGAMAGVYTSPYLATISSNTDANSGTKLYVICDDFQTDSYIGQSFTANATQVSALTGADNVKFDDGNASAQQTDYAVVAYLAEEIINAQTTNPADTATLGELSFALWNVFDPGLLNNACSQYGCLTTAELSQARIDYQTAVSNHLNYTSYSEVWIYTPIPSTISQEFIYVDPPSMPEPSGISILGAGLLGLIGASLRRKRGVGAAGK